MKLSLSRWDHARDLSGVDQLRGGMRGIPGPRPTAPLGGQEPPRRRVWPTYHHRWSGDVKPGPCVPCCAHNPPLPHCPQAKKSSCRLAPDDHGEWDICTNGRGAASALVTREAVVDPRMQRSGRRAASIECVVLPFLTLLEGPPLLWLPSRLWLPSPPRAPSRIPVPLTLPSVPALTLPRDRGVDCSGVATSPSKRH